MKKIIAYIIISVFCLNAGGAIIPVLSDAVAHALWYRQHKLEKHRHDADNHHLAHDHLAEEVQDGHKKEEDPSGTQIPVSFSFEKTVQDFQENQPLCPSASFINFEATYADPRFCMISISQKIANPPPETGLPSRG